MKKIISNCIKCVNAILISAIIALSFTVGVRAEYVTMIDYGFGYYNANSYISWVNGAGSTITGRYFMWYWAIDSFDPDYTYTFTFRFTSSESLPNYASYFVYISRQKYTASQSLDPVGVYSVLTKDNNNYTATVKLNFGLLGITEFPAYVTMKLNNTLNITTTVNGWGVSAEYDPGGSKLMDEYLADISYQLHRGDDYTAPDSAASDLKDSLNSLDSAEASLSSKADELRTASSSTMNSALSAAKDLPNKIGTSTTFLATTFTSFWEAVPEEVTAVLLVCAAILFAGWLIGRVQ